MGYKLMATKSFVVCIMVSMEVVLGAASVVHQQPPAMFVLGDSYLDVGNNNFLPGAGVPRANMPYYGVDFPGFPTGRFSNGRNTADYIAKKIGFKSSPPPYLALAPNSSLLVLSALTTGVSYASGGAGILDSTNAGNNIPLSKQVQYFNATKSKMVAKVGSAAVSARISKSFVLIAFGGNDLAQNRSAAEQQSDAAAFYDSLISKYSAAFKDLYDLGARKFAVIGVGLGGCLPVGRVLSASGACSDARNQVAAGLDDAVLSMLARLNATLPGFLYSMGDANALMADTFADPQASGFTDVSSACCGGGRLGAEAVCSINSTICANRDQHYFWDAVHITQQAAKQRAQTFYDGQPQYTTPINIKQLVDA